MAKSQRRQLSRLEIVFLEERIPVLIRDYCNLLYTYPTSKPDKYTRTFISFSIYNSSPLSEVLERLENIDPKEVFIYPEGNSVRFEASIPANEEYLKSETIKWQEKEEKLELLFQQMLPTLKELEVLRITNEKI